MMSSRYMQLTAFQQDVLREVGNIGAGNAATALSTMLNRPIDMRLPLVNVLPFEDIVALLGGAEQIVVAIYLRVEGDVPGNLFFLLKEEGVARLFDPLFGAFGAEVTIESELGQSALAELGNMMAGSYLSALADLMQLKMYPSVPYTTTDMLGAIVSSGLLVYGEMGDQALFIDATFLEGHDPIEGHVFFVPDPDTFDPMFRALGVPLE